MCYFCPTIHGQENLVQFKNMKTKRLSFSRIKTLPVMIVKFFKTNWFYIALSLLVVGAVVRKTFHTGAPGKIPLEQVKKAEKFTADQRGSEEGVSLFGGIASGPRTLRKLPDIDAATAESFLRRFGKVTPGEQQKFGVPASVLLAAAYVNSSAGQRDMATTANNYFALLCSGDWQGRTMAFDGRCYRQYERPWDSFRDFSRLLAAQPWYAEGKKTAGRDWQAWVKLLDGKGLSDVENFGAEIEKVIRAYRLFELDGK